MPPISNQDASGVNIEVLVASVDVEFKAMTESIGIKNARAMTESIGIKNARTMTESIRIGKEKVMTENIGIKQGAVIRQILHPALRKKSSFWYPAPSSRHLRKIVLVR